MTALKALLGGVAYLGLAACEMPAAHTMGHSGDDAMMSDSETMMKDGDAMMKDDDTMMSGS